MEIDKKQLGRRIKDIRVNTCNATMEEFANLVGSGKSNVSRWERGENIPNDLTLKTIAELGKITVNELVYGELKDFVKRILIDELENNAKLWNHVYNYLLKLSEMPESLLNTEMLNNSDELNRDMYHINKSQLRHGINFIENNLDQLLKELTTISKPDNIYHDKDLIVNTTINYIMRLSLMPLSFEQYYFGLRSSLLKVMPHTETDQDVESLIKIYEQAGLSSELAKQKAYEVYYQSKMSKIQISIIDEIDEVWEEFKNKISELD